jgi:hypothetical protein
LGLGYPAVTQGLEDNPMSTWLSENEKKSLVEIAKSMSDSGRVVPTEALKTKMELDAVETAARAANASERAANASERNAKYMLASTIFAAASAVASFLAVIVPLFIKH